MKKNKIWILALMLISSSVTVSSEERTAVLGKTRTGTLTYQAEDNIDFKEGTLEFWLKINFDPAQYQNTKKTFFSLLQLFRISGEKGGISVEYFIRNNKKPSLVCTILSKTRMKPLILGKYIFKKNQWYHLALLWKGKKIWSYVNGANKREVNQNEFLYREFEPLNSQKIFFGDKYHRKSLMLIDDLRISTVARQKEELGFFKGKLKQDIYTRLLDPFDTLAEDNKKMMTLPTVISNGKNGKISDNCQLVDNGKFGKALSFFNK